MFKVLDYRRATIPLVTVHNRRRSRVQHRLSYQIRRRCIIGPLKSKMAEIRRHATINNWHDVIFSAEGGPIWIKFRRLVQNDMSTAVMWSKSKADVEFQYGGRLGEFNGMSSQSHVSHCRVLPLGEFTVAIPEPRHIAGCSYLVKSMSWSCHIAGSKNFIAILKIVFRHILFFLFLMQFRLWLAAAFVSSPIHLCVVNWWSCHINRGSPFF